MKVVLWKDATSTAGGDKLWDPGACSDLASTNGVVDYTASLGSSEANALASLSSSDGVWAEVSVGTGGSCTNVVQPRFRARGHLFATVSHVASRALEAGSYSGNVSDSQMAAMQGASASSNGTQGMVPAPSAGEESKFLRGDGTWQTPSAGGGDVTSVALSMPPEFSVSGATITTNGTWAVTKANQNANEVFAGPTGCLEGSQVFTYTGSDQTLAIPDNCDELTVKMWAGGGGGSWPSGSIYPVGGGGGYAEGTLTVTPGESLTIEVGGGGVAGGSGGYPGGGTGNALGGGGGGRSAIRRSSTYLAIAGGGGGGGTAMWNCGGNGGGGGGSSGGDATGCSGDPTNGAGGTSSAGGAKGTGVWTSSAQDGSSLHGGAGELYAGGGGDGYYGGGGGGANISGSYLLGGGGGGSGYFPSGTLTAATGQSAANNTDPDYASNAGRGGDSYSAGQPGRVIVQWAKAGGNPQTPASFRALETGDVPALSAAKITSGVLGLSQGGTGVTTVVAARSVLGLDDLALQDRSSVQITGGNIGPSVYFGSYAGAPTGYFTSFEAYLPQSYLWVGNSGGGSSAELLTGDATLSDLGVMTVQGLQGATVSSTAPSSGQVLGWSASASRWTPMNAGTLRWNQSTSGPVAMQANRGYFTTHMSSRIELDLPSSCSIGDTIRAVAQGDGGFSIVPASGQTLWLGDGTSVTSSGSLDSDSSLTKVELLCLNTNTDWLKLASGGGGSGIPSFDSVIPTMTSATTPSGVASDSTSGGLPWYAFDKVTTGCGSGWYLNVGTTTGWLQYQMPSTTTVVKYAVTAMTCYTTAMPKDWTLEGSNDGSNWTTLDTRSSESSWVDAETRQYVLSSPASYIYFRINVSANNGNGSYTGLAEWNMWGY